MAALMTLRGIPQIYYGSEIGMTGKKENGDGDIRRDFPGGWISDKKSAFNEKERTPLQKSYFNFTKKLINWRRTKSVIHNGKTLHYGDQKFLIEDPEIHAEVFVSLNGRPSQLFVDKKHDLTKFKYNLYHRKWIEPFQE